MADEFKAADNFDHVGGAFFGLGADAFHDEAGEIFRDGWVDVARGGDAIVDEEAVVAFLEGEEGGDGSACQGPIEGCAEVEDVGADGDGLAAHLLGGDVVGRALDAFLDGSDFAGLAVVDDFYSAAWAEEDVIGLEIAVDVAEVVHGLEAFANLDEAIDDADGVAGLEDFERLAIEHFEDQNCFGRFSKQRFIFLELDGPAQVRMGEVAADFVFGFQLFYESNVPFGLANDMLHCVDLLGFGVGHYVENTARAFTNEVNDLVPEELSGELRCTRLT